MLSVSITRNNAVFYALILLSASLINGMAIKEKHFLLPENKKATSVYHHEEDGFYVVKNNTERYNIPSHDISKELRHCSKEELKGYLKTGFLELKKMSDESYKIEGHQRGLAGGPILGSIFYGITKSACYAGLVGAGTAAVCATGGIGAGAVVGGVGAVGAMGAGAAAGTVVATGVGGAVGVVATTTTGIAVTTVIAGASVAAYGSVVAGIEALSWAAFLAGTAIPFL